MKLALGGKKEIEEKRRMKKVTGFWRSREKGGKIEEMVSMYIFDSKEASGIAGVRSEKDER